MVLCVSHERLYQWIWIAKKSHHCNFIFERDLYKHLRHAKIKQKLGNYRKNCGAIVERVPIDQSTTFIEKRSNIGKIEVDLMIGKNHQSPLLVMIERAILITTIDFLKSKETELVKAINEKRINWVGVSWSKTFSFDNELAFALHYEHKAKFNIKHSLLDLKLLRIKDGSELD